MCRWQRSGSVLILVVWTISLLSVLALGLGSRCAFALSLTQRLEQQLRASYIAAAGVQRSAEVLAEDLSLLVDGANDIWFNNGTLFREQSFGGGVFSVGAVNRGTSQEPTQYGLVDQERFINLNTAPAEILKALVLRSAPVKDLEATTIAESIIDWRDKDKDPLPSGAEEYYYLTLNPPYACKDAPFESLEELLLVRGVTPAIYQKIRPSLTVYGSGAVNINTADEVVLSAIGMSASGVAAILAYRAGEDDELHTSDDRVLSSIAAVASEVGAPAEDVNRLTRLAAEKLVGVGSTAFEASVTGDFGRENRSVRTTAVMDRKGRILAWEES